MLAFNIGSDGRTEEGFEQLSDEQLRANWEFERYKIIFVSDFQTPIGILHRTAAIKGR